MFVLYSRFRLYLATNEALLKNPCLPFLSLQAPLLGEEKKPEVLLTKAFSAAATMLFLRISVFSI